jgi:hypothetical protein
VHFGLVLKGGQVLPKCGASPTRTPYTRIHYGQYMRAPAVKVWAAHRVRFPNPVFCSHHDYYSTDLKRRGALVGLSVEPRLPHVCILEIYLAPQVPQMPRPTRLFYDSMIPTVWETDVIMGGYSAAAAFPCTCRLCVCELQFPVSSLIDPHP